jgi:hypothetical protein
MVAVWLPLAIYAQARTLTGRVVDKKNKAVPQATVMLKEKNGLVLYYAASNNNGEFRMSISDTLVMQGLFLEVSHLSFKKIAIQVTSDRFNYSVILEENATVLPDVKVTGRPSAVVKGDTTSYNVSSFSRGEDRSIGDVLKRIPGITVDDNGKIYYNGKAISNLYIHGDDVMDGRYNMATQAIKKELIQSIDVMQNHQPIKVLQHRKSSDEVAINLVLKNENSLALSGQATIGAGVPGLYDGTINGLVLNKKVKLINSLKANNSGIDYGNDLAQPGNSMSMAGPTSLPDLLSAGTVGNPDLPRQNYYFNKSAIINLNNLYNNGRGWQLRSNIQAFIDRQALHYQNETWQYVKEDTAIYREWQQAITKPYMLQTAFTVMGNKSKYYFVNRLSTNISGKNIDAALHSNNIALQQQLGTKRFDITNQMQYTPALRNKNLLDLQWVVNYSSSKQTLLADTGLLPAILNGGVPYEATKQDVSMPVFSQQLAFSWLIPNVRFRQSYDGGLITERQQLVSGLNLGFSNGHYEPYQKDVGNNLHWQRDRLYVNADYSYVLKHFEARLSMPVAWQSIRYYQNEYHLDERYPQLLWSPALTLKVQLNAEDYLLLNSYRTNDMGNLTGVYRGTILTNYRSLQASDAGLQSMTTTGARLHYNFQRSVILLLFNVGLEYNKVSANSILSSVVTDNVQRIILQPFKNDQSNLTLDAGISKYLFGLKSTVSLSAKFNQGRYDQFINAAFQPWRNRTLLVKTSFDSKLFDRITFRYNGAITRSYNEQIGTAGGEKVVTNGITRLDQQAWLGVSTGAILFVSLRGRHLYNQQPGLATVNYLFADLNVRYKCKAWRTDFEFDLINLANVKSYDLLRVSSNLMSATRYDVRGRMAMLKATFNF